MLLTFNNFSIRNAELEDADLLCRWWNDGEVMAHAGYPNGLNTTPEAIRASLMTDADGIHRRLIMEIDKVPVGEMNYRHQGDKKAIIGIKICEPSQQNQGAGTIFLKMLITSLFNDLGYETIVLDTNLNNTRAQHVYEKLGFRKIKINQDAFQDQLGQWQSSVDYELHAWEFDHLEIWDGYNEQEERIGVDLIRGAEIPQGVFHLVVTVLIKHVDGSYLLMQRDYHKTYPGIFEATAGGSVLKGETPMEAAIREVYEETGIKINELSLINKTILEPGIYYYYLSETDCDKSSVKLQAGETIDFKWLSEQEFLEFVESEAFVKIQRVKLEDYLHSIRNK